MLAQSWSSLACWWTPLGQTRLAICQHMGLVAPQVGTTCSPGTQLQLWIDGGSACPWQKRPKGPLLAAVTGDKVCATWVERCGEEVYNDPQTPPTHTHTQPHPSTCRQGLPFALTSYMPGNYAILCNYAQL